MTSVYAGQEPMEPRPPDDTPHVRAVEFDHACDGCFAEWDGTVECPSCGRAAVREGDRVTSGGHAGTVTLVAQLVSVKWDTGVTERCSPSELRHEED